MKAMSGRDLARVVEHHGWVPLRVHGSHHIYGKEGSVVRLVIPMHENRPLKAGLSRHILEMAGLSEEDLQGK
jgi:predicted RNA binding protein YcfA (HicA-like mRNA interferase family)